MDDLKAHFLLDPDVIFLNHGSFGACPRPVFEAYQNFQRELERQPVAFLNRRFPRMMYEARVALADFLGTQPENLVYVPNATTASNVVAHSVPLGSGDEVLSTDLAYGAVDRMWQHVAAKSGAVYRKVHVPLPVPGDHVFTEGVWSAVTERTRVLSLSHITSSTGLVLPIEPLLKKARDAGILTLVDGAHAPGQIDLRLDELSADFYAGNCHKWMMAPKGAGFLWARPQVQAIIEPLVVSWGDMSVEASRFVQENEYQGTRDIAPYLAVPAAIRFFREHDWAGVASKCRVLAQKVREMFVETLGGPPLAPPSWYAQLVAHELTPDNPERIKGRLYDEFRIEIPISQLGQRWFVRASIQAYNDPSDYEALRRALIEIGARSPHGVPA